MRTETVWGLVFSNGDIAMSGRELCIYETEREAEIHNKSIDFRANVVQMELRIPDFNLCVEKH